MMLSQATTKINGNLNKFILNNKIINEKLLTTKQWGGILLS